jgi:glycosyltransferase involved in cell wall biosynthesis
MLEITNGNRCVFVSWAPFCSRSDSIAAHLDASSYMIYSASWGSHYSTILFKYLTQAVRTLRLLMRERPAMVFVMTPPVIACVPVWLYSRLSGAGYVIDAHSGAFLQQPWKALLFLHKFFSRQARTTIVTNEYLKSMVTSWGASATIVSDVPVRFANPRPIPTRGAHRMTFVSSFQKDEPFDVFVEAARAVPDVVFYVTGDSSKLSPSVREALPVNVELVGFLPDGQYRALLDASDAVITLTTLDHTMQRGAYEAVYLGKPVVVSNTAILRRHFPRGAVHVENTPTDVARGIREMIGGLGNHTAEVLQLKEQKLTAWQCTLAQLRGIVDTPAEPDAA